MLQVLRVALAATVLAVFLHASAASPARAELSAELLGKVEVAVQHDTIDAVIAALRDLFAANPSRATEIAVAAVAFNPGQCWACAIAAARAVPGRAFRIARAIVGELPECGEDVIAAMSKVLPDLSDLFAVVVAEATRGSSAGPGQGKGPSSDPEDTDEDDDDHGSPR